MKRQNFLMLAAAALLASCSQDDALQNTVLNNEGLKPMTITASLPTDGMQTRAAGDEAATRCYVQILNGDGNDTFPRRHFQHYGVSQREQNLRLPILGRHGS